MANVKIDGIQVAVNNPSSFWPLNQRYAVVINATPTDNKIHRSDVFIFIYPLNKLRLFFFPKSPWSN